jgi:hypothetical protein
MFALRDLARNLKRGVDSLFKNSRENLAWFKDNYDNLLKEFDKCWVVIAGKKVVASGSSFDEVVKAARKYDSSSVIVEFIESEPIAMFF